MFSCSLSSMCMVRRKKDGGREERGRVGKKKDGKGEGKRNAKEKERGPVTAAEHLIMSHACITAKVGVQEQSREEGKENSET
jgi:hypothetical protein